MSLDVLGLICFDAKQNGQQVVLEVLLRRKYITSQRKIRKSELVAKELA
jgi:hypothetical protein